MSLEKIKFSTPMPVPDKFGNTKYMRKWPLPYEPEIREVFGSFGRKTKLR